jgi:hypothetical protein
LQFFKCSRILNMQKHTLGIKAKHTLH